MEDKVINEYYEKIMSMTLNISDEEIYKIMEFVESNHLFEEEFYNNLYAVIEKEKYLREKFNYKGSLYANLSDDTKAILMQMFMKNMAYDYKNLIDYANVIDPKYRIFFDTCEFTNNQTYDLDEGKLSIKSARPYYGNNKIVRISDREDLMLARDDDNRNMRVYKLKNVQRSDNNDSEYYFVQLNSQLDFNTAYYAINKNTGKRIRIPLRIGSFPSYKLGYFIDKYKLKRDASWTTDFYDEKFRRKMRLKDVDLYADYIKKVFLVVCDDGSVNIYNQNLELLKTINFARELYGNYKIIGVNDGIVSLSLFGRDRIIYYDYINMQEVDSFKYTGDDFFQFVYSEGLYTFVDSNGKCGYKNINKEIIYEPIFNEAWPFLENIAIVCDKVHLIMNRTGKCINISDCLKKVFESRKKFVDSHNHSFFAIDAYHYLFYGHDKILFVLDYKKGKYQLHHYINSINKYINEGHLVTKDNYIINVDIPIKDITFEEKGEVMKLVK